MLFGLTNAPATFQAYINKMMISILNEFYIIYLDDILIYLNTKEEHVRHVKEVLWCLASVNLYAKLSKYKFYKTKVKFLSFLVGRDGVYLDLACLSTISEWPAPCSFYNV
jgi:hypothetical protein